MKATSESSTAADAERRRVGKWVRREKPVHDGSAEAIETANRAQRRLRSTFMALAALMVVFTVVAGVALSTIRAQTIDIADNRFPSVRVIDGIREQAYAHRKLVLTYAVTDQGAAVDRFALRSAMARVTDRGRRMFDIYGPLVSDRADAELLEEASASWSDYLDAAARVSSLDEAKGLDQLLAQFDSDVDPAFDRLRRRLDGWIALNTDAVEAHLHAADSTFRTGIAVLVAALVLLLGTMVGAVRMATRTITEGGSRAADLLDAAALEADRATVFQRLADQLAFATDETDLVGAAHATLQRLVGADQGDILLLNASRDRLTVGTAWGSDVSEPGTVVDTEPDRCPGIRRGAVYEGADVSDELTISCSVHPAVAGSLLCVPMIALGQTVGVVHLERSSRFSDQELRLAVRTCEQVALALSNARMLQTLESLAMTDALTGLHNARFFDPLVDVELTTATRDREPVAVLMIDLDHFKKLNDTHGHQAGDEALRSFGATLRSVLRASDPAARYGGEEFAVMLRSTDEATAMEIAENVRAAVESTPIALGAGRETHMTASIGVATTDQAGYDRAALLRLADRALYRGKQAGRNRVELADALLDADPELRPDDLSDLDTITG